MQRNINPWANIFLYTHAQCASFIVHVVFLVGKTKDLFGDSDAFATLINIRPILSFENQYRKIAELAQGKLRKQRDSCRQSEPWGLSTWPEALWKTQSIWKASCICRPQFQTWLFTACLSFYISNWGGAMPSPDIPVYLLS